MKKLLSLLLCLALVLTLAACGSEPDPTVPPTEAPTTVPTEPPTEPPTTEPPITVEDVYAKTADAMKRFEASGMRMDMSFSASYTTGEGENAETETVSYSMLLDSRTTKEPFGTYTLTSIGMDMGGFNMDIDVEVYILEENGTLVTYTNYLGTWSRVDMEMTVEEYLSNSDAADIDTSDVWSGDIMPAGMTLDPFTQVLDYTEVYILRANLPADSIGDAIAGMGMDLGENMDTLTMPVIYYVDTQNYTVLRMEAEMQVLADVLSASLAESLLGDADQAVELTLDIPTVLYDLSYGNVEIPTLPQEAIDQTREPDPTEPVISDVLPVAGEASDLGNGNFVLPCGDEAFLIPCPENWSGEVYSSNNIWIYNEDQSLYGDFYYLTGYTEDNIRNQIQMDADDLKDMDIFISSGDGPVYEGFTTASVMGEGESYCYVWTPMDEGFLVVILADYTETPDFEAQIHQVLDLIVPYTGEFAEKAIAADLGNGQFSLPCGSQNVTISCPEGFSGEVYEENNIWLYNKDGSVYGDYFYLSGWVTEDIMTYWILEDVDAMKSENASTTLEDGPAIEGYRTQVLQGDSISYYYAWAPMGNGCFLLQVYDWDGGNDALELLTMLLECITYE